MSKTISVCIIAKDEEERIGTAIKCAKPFADEIIVVDTGSSDRTPEVARELGAKVYYFKWCDDFSAARNESLKHATCDWILWLDADDFIDDENIQKIIELKDKLPAKRNTAYYFLIESKMEEGGDENTWYWFQLRLFPKYPDVKFEGRIHEQIITSLKRRNIQDMYTTIKVIHLGYIDKSKLPQKLERNLRLLLEEEKEATTIPFWAKRYIAFSLLQLGKIEEAERKINEALELVPKEAKMWLFDLMMTKANIMRQKGDWDGVLQCLNDVEKIRPDEGTINLMKSEVFFVKGMYEKAYEELQIANKKGFLMGIIPISPDVVKKRYLMGKARLLFRLGRFEEAKEAFLELKKLSENMFVWEPSLDDFVDTLIKVGDWKSLYDVLKELEDKIPAHQIGNLALAAEKIGKFEEAENYYKKAYEKQSENTDILFNFANFMFMRGNMSEALRLFTKYLKEVSIVPQNEVYILSALTCVANILMKAGDVKSAVDLLSTACEISGIYSFADDFTDLAEVWIELSDRFKGDYIKLLALENAALTMRYSKDDEKANKVNLEIVKRIEKIKRESFIPIA